eukprot:1563644-Amphidinium_carterae.1
MDSKLLAARSMPMRMCMSNQSGMTASQKIKNPLHLSDVNTVCHNFGELEALVFGIACPP